MVSQQEKVMKALKKRGDWSTAGQVAATMGVNLSTTIRVILDTLAYAKLIRCEWGWTGKQNAKMYKFIKETGNE